LSPTGSAESLIDGSGVYEWVGSANPTSVLIDLALSYAGFGDTTTPGGSGTVTRITFYGNGTNPYFENCDEPTPTPSPTRTPTPTRTPSPTLTPSITRTPSPTFVTIPPTSAATGTRTPINTAVIARTPTITPTGETYIVNFDNANPYSLGSVSGSPSSVISTGYGRSNTAEDGGAYADGSNNTIALVVNVPLPDRNLSNVAFDVRAAHPDSDPYRFGMLIQYNGVGGEVARYNWDAEFRPNTWRTTNAPAVPAFRVDSATIIIAASGTSGMLSAFAAIDDIRFTFGTRPTPIAPHTSTPGTSTATRTFIPSPTRYITITPGGPTITPGGPTPVGTLTIDQTQTEIQIGIFESIGNFFTWLTNTITGIFDFFAALIAWVVATVQNVFTFFGNLLSLIAQLIGGAISLFRELIDIGSLLIQIVLRMLTLILSWFVQMVAQLGGILAAFYSAPPTAIPAMPQCVSAPMTYDICAIYYILDFTLFAPGTPGALIIPILLIIVDINAVLYFASFVMKLIRRGEKITDVG
jgi:hypothetical protein